ncbi:HhoA/HhoB/HtrA family serine endopeptidase [Synechococcus sp. PCC 7336]|uniref:HhoA/HhoB/HtrA family serine endopeptidase n=1 Tax=Synechococcus sp. PCC 7336 TaxID=195250 RepID=UPI000347DC42|nr:HhoA/HhoB/HtrA family serine endopeptidase [Synechococcus sp. PCC 7336]
MNVNPRVRQLTLALLLFGMGLGSGILASGQISDSSEGSDGLSGVAASPAVADSEPAIAAAPLSSDRSLSFISDVVRAVGPAVVRIDATKVIETSVASPFGNPLFSDPYLRRFFGNLPELRREYRQQGTGSGFIISSDGKIVTNAHVVDRAAEVEVRLQDGRTFTGRVIGSDPVTDIALVQIEAEDLPTVALGDSDRVQVGEWAIAIGNPLGLDSTVTAGIVSAVSRSPREVGIPDKRVNFIQTDTAINPGNSGGPLLDASGNVIGVNTAIIRGASGVGFAIPINTAAAIARQLEASGTVEHPYLGIEMIALTATVREQLNSDPNSGFFVEREEGILVRRVVPDSPAERAGLRAGDIIVQIDGETVTNAEQVQQKVFNTSVGSTLRLELDRNGRTQQINIQTGAYPVARNS